MAILLAAVAPTVAGTAGYTLGAKDVGNALALTVKTADGTSLYAAAVGPVASRTAQLAQTKQPAITGTPAVGQKLSVDSGAWSTPPTGYTYAWLRGNANGRICVTIASHSLVATVNGVLSTRH